MTLPGRAVPRLPMLVPSGRTHERFQRSKPEAALWVMGAFGDVMTGSLSTFAWAIGTVLASSVVATTMILVGINPVLSVLAAAVLVLDVLYYHRQSSVNTDAAMQELSSLNGGGRHYSSVQDSQN